LATARLESDLTRALLSLIEIASTPKLPSRILRPHLTTLLAFCLSLLNPSPNPTSPHYSSQSFDETVRAPAVELLISISEYAPTMVKSHPTFINDIVPALLNIMCEREENETWLQGEAFDDDDNEDDSLAVIGEGGIDRLSRALGSSLLPPINEVRLNVWRNR
jgi:hypothetical protein